MTDREIPGKLDPQMAQALAKSQELAPGFEQIHKLSIPEIRRRYREERRFWNEDAPDLPAVTEHTIEGPVGPVPIRLYYPATERPLPALVFAHGGGWIMGDLDTHNKIMRLLALGSGAAVVGIDYSLSPEQKFPVAIEETVALLNHLAESGAGWGIDPKRLALGGDSAGANMTVAAALSLKPTQPDLLKALLLYYGAYGLKDSASRRLYGGDEDGLSEQDMALYRDSYLRDPSDAEDPLRHNLRADLSGLPPAFIAAAELDPLYDDSVALAGRLQIAGVERELVTYDGVLHGFLHLSRMVDKAGQAIDDGVAFLKRTLAP